LLAISEGWVGIVRSQTKATELVSLVSVVYDESEGIFKGNSRGPLTVKSHKLLGGTKENHEITVMIAVIRFDVRTEQLYLSTEPLDQIPFDLLLEVHRRSHISCLSGISWPSGRYVRLLH
jgi:hypothetical protein